MKPTATTNTRPASGALSKSITAILRQGAYLSGVVSAGGLMLASHNAWSQSVDAAVGKSDNVLEEVIVTAQRRSQSVQDVPYNITAIDSGTIAQAGAVSINDLTRVVPGLTTVDTGEGARGRTNNLTLRGLRTDSPGGGSAAAELPGQTVNSVSTYFGETPVFFPMPLYDIQRVEVLRGPQGTLYGSGAQAGTIRFVPTRPAFDKFSGEVEVTGSATERAVSFDNLNRDVKGILNLPLADHLALRVVAGRKHDGGFIDNVDLVERAGPGQLAVPTPSIPGDLTSGPVIGPVARNTNYSDQWFARGSLRWQPAEAVDLQVDYLHQYVHSGNSQFSNPGYPGGLFDLTTPIPTTPSPTNPSFWPNSAFNMRGGGTYESTAFIESPDTDKINLFSAVATIDLGLATVTSTTSYYDDKSIGVSDWTPQQDNLAGANYNIYAPYNNYPREIAIQPIQADDHAFVQELRLVSSGENRFDYVLGAFYQRQAGLNELNQTQPGITSYLDSIGMHNPTTYGDLIWQDSRKTLFQDRAVFGELTLHATHSWQVTAGTRFFRQTFTNNAVILLPLCGAVCASDLTNPAGLTADSNTSSYGRHVWKFNTAYDFGPDLKVYATYSEGFRRGGANGLSTAGSFASLPVYQTYAPDLAKNYEVGVKGFLFDKTVSYSADIYRINLTDFQFNGLTPYGTPATYNGKDARSQGLEFSTQAALSRSTTVSFGYNFTDAKVKKTFVLYDYQAYALIPSFGGTGQLAPVEGGPITAGSKLPGVPRQTASFGLDHTIPLDFTSTSGWMLTLHADGSYRTSEVANIQPGSPYNWTIPSSFLGNARAIVDTGALSYSFFVDNFSNDPGYSGGQFDQAVPNYSRDRFVARPRTWGVSLRYKF